MSLQVLLGRFEGFSLIFFGKAIGFKITVC